MVTMMGDDDMMVVMTRVQSPGPSRLDAPW
jgi:hypothetical protein